MQARPEYPVVTAAIDIVTGWWRRRDRNGAEFDEAADADVERMAKDLGVSTMQLRMLARRGEEPLLVPRMLQALRIDPKGGGAPRPGHVARPPARLRLLRQQEALRPGA